MRKQGVVDATERNRENLWQNWRTADERILKWVSINTVNTVRYKGFKLIRLAFRPNLWLVTVLKHVSTHNTYCLFEVGILVSNSVVTEKFSNSNICRILSRCSSCFYGHYNTRLKDRDLSNLNFKTLKAVRTVCHSFKYVDISGCDIQVDSIKNLWSTADLV